MQAPKSVFLNLFPGYPYGMDWAGRLSEKFAATGWSKAELAKRADPDFQEPLVFNDVDDGIDMSVSAKVLWIIRKP